MITKSNTIYDLTELVKTGRDNWRAVDGTSTGITGIHMNVCGALTKNSLTNGCPTDSGVCIVNGQSHISLGSFKSLESDALNSLSLVYEGGTFCDLRSQKRKKAVVTFICHPGQLSTVPTLISISADQCNYEFIWQTGEINLFYRVLCIYYIKELRIFKNRLVRNSVLFSKSLWISFDSNKFLSFNCTLNYLHFNDCQ